MSFCQLVALDKAKSKLHRQPLKAQEQLWHRVGAGNEAEERGLD